MQEFIREILNNTNLMMMLMFIFAFTLSLLAFEKFRKIIFGSIVSSLVSIGLTVASRVDTINDIFSLIFKNAFFFRFGDSFETINGLNKFIFIFVDSFDLKYSYSIGYVNYFGYVTKDFLFGFRRIDYKENKVAKAEYEIEFSLAEKIKLSRQRQIIRI